MKPRFWLTATAIMLCTGRGVAQQPNLVVNGDFSKGPAGTIEQGAKDFDGWTVTKGSIALLHLQGSHIQLFAPGAVLKQTLATIPGQSYRLRFMLSGVPLGSNTKTMTLSVGDVSKGFRYEG